MSLVIYIEIKTMAHHDIPVAKRKLTEGLNNTPPSPPNKRQQVEEQVLRNQAKEEKLHPKQQGAIDAAKEGRNVFITGQGGV